MAITSQQTKGDQMDNERTSSSMPDEFDRTRDGLGGMVSKTKEVVIPTVPLFGVGGGRSWILQTIRQQDVGDTILLQLIGPANEGFRLVLPPKLTSAIGRQREALTARSRKRAARAGAATRKAQGVEPFVKKGGR